MTEASVSPLSRRDRLRADTVREIKETARRVLVDQGVDGLALRAVAREMGMSAPALYRYFDSREDLVENVVADLYDELVGVLEAARDAARPATAPVQLLACARAFRRWAITHHAEFGLLFGSAGDGVVPAHGASATDDSLAQLAALPIERKIYIHVNNTNPILLDDAPERRMLSERGMEVAVDGLEVKV